MIRKRIAKRVAWDGPHPRAGEYLAMRDGNGLWLIEVVRVIRDGTLTIDLLRQVGTLPAGAVIHPATRIQPSDPAGPPRIRQVTASGPTAVMRDAWRDPTDTTPNASRRPREINGYRTYCPLRRMMARNGSQVTRAHILAADFFRLQVDLAVIGCGGMLDGSAVGQAYGPRAGPSAAQIQQAMAAAAVKRAFARFAPSHHTMLIEVVLRNRSLHAWCALAAQGKPLDPDIEMGRLLTILDILADHYDTDIKADLAVGAILEPA